MDCFQDGMTYCRNPLVNWSLGYTRTSGHLGRRIFYPHDCRLNACYKLISHGDELHRNNG